MCSMGRVRKEGRVVASTSEGGLRVLWVRWTALASRPGNVA